MIKISGPVIFYVEQVGHVQEFNPAPETQQLHGQAILGLVQNPIAVVVTVESHVVSEPLLHSRHSGAHQHTGYEVCDATVV